MVEGRTLGAFRDIVIIIGMAVLCFLGMQDAVSRAQTRREQEARFAPARNAIGRSDDGARPATGGSAAVARTERVPGCGCRKCVRRRDGHR